MAKKPAKKKSALEDAIGSIDPTALAGDEESVYIGVPQGSELEQRLTNLHRTPAARKLSPSVAGKAFQAYSNGDDLSPAQWDPNDLVALQMRLNMAGMLDSFIPGSFDKATREAYRDLLSMSNASVTSWESMLDQVSAVGKVDDKEGPPPLVVELRNPEDLKAIANKVAQTAFGGDLPDDIQERFVSAFQEASRAEQTAAYNARYGGAAQGEVTSAPDPSVMAENLIKEEQPNQYAATQFGNRMDEILSTFTGNRAGIR